MGENVTPYTKHENRIINKEITKEIEEIKK